MDTTQPLGITFNDLDDVTASRLSSIVGTKTTFIEVNPGKVVISSRYKNISERIIDLEVRPDDVWLMAYPRTGSTWTLEMVWCIMNDLDFETALSGLILSRCPLLEYNIIKDDKYEELQNKVGDSMAMVENLQSPRIIRSHLPRFLLPRQLDTVKPKIVYVARDPKDVCVSYYYFQKMVNKTENCSFEDFCDLFLKGKVPYGNYLDHVLGFWEQRDSPNVLFLKYEDVKKDVRKSIYKLAEFLGKHLTEDQVSSLIDHASFSKMRENRSVNLEPLMEHIYKATPSGIKDDYKFIRKGQVGDWKNHMNEEMVKRFDEWAAKKLKGTGLFFATH